MGGFLSVAGITTTLMGIYFIKKEQEKFTERLKYLAALLHKKRDVVIELDIAERENSSEIMEQLQCEEKTDSIEIRWKND